MFFWWFYTPTKDLKHWIDTSPMAPWYLRSSSVAFSSSSSLHRHLATKRRIIATMYMWGYAQEQTHLGITIFWYFIWYIFWYIFRNGLLLDTIGFTSLFMDDLWYRSLPDPSPKAICPSLHGSSWCLQRWCTPAYYKVRIPQLCWFMTSINTIVFYGGYSLAHQCPLGKMGGVSHF